MKNFFVKCGFSTNVDSAVELSEDEEDDWHSLQPLEVQSEDYPTYGSVLKACGVQSVDQVLGQHLTRPEEEEEEVAEYKATFLDALKGLEADRKYIQGLTIKFANLPLCACHGSSGQKPQYGLMMLAYQCFPAVLLLIYGSL
jgi:hypothetical protein